MKKVLYVGLDVHKESIVVATAPQGDTEAQLYGKIGGTLDALDKVIKKMARPDLELRFVYEAGPCGYVIYRHLKKQGYHCQVIAPSLIPTKASDRVKTDRRDARQLARLFRAGELTAIYVPDEEDEAVRDLVRARDRAMVDQRKARQRLKGFLLRLGHRYLGRGNWSAEHLRYLAQIKLSHAAQQIAFQEYLEAITVATERLERLTKAMEAALPAWKRAPVVHAVMSLRGVALINGMTLIAEAGDLTRFDSPTSLMSYFGLTPSEYSSGEKRVQGGITKAGNGACRRALVEAAHHYRIAPRVSPAMQKRQEDQSKEVRAIALKAQQRLHSRYRLLTARQKKPVIVIAALARELCGFVWAIACQLSAPEKLKTREKGTSKETKAAVQTTPAPVQSSVLTETTKKTYQLNAEKTFKKQAVNTRAIPG
jgi:transposase